MNTVLIFLPSDIQNGVPGYLIGNTEKYPTDNVNVFFVYGKVNACDVHNEKFSVIGHCFKSGSREIEECSRGKQNWIVVWADVKKPIIKDLRDADVLHSAKKKVICVLYDVHSMMHAELLLNNSHYQHHHDYFKVLASNIRSMAPPGVNLRRTAHATVLPTVTKKILTLILCFISILMNGVSCLTPILKYSSLGMHLVAYINSLSWTFRSVVKHKKLSLKVGNFLLAKLVDISCGVLVLSLLMPILTSSSLTHQLLSAANDVVTALQELPIWLMGVPAGFKLNHAFNTMLGKFFLYHINLWWTFLVVAKPLLELVFQVFLCFGWLGLTFQVSILADLLALVSFHVYCIYVYAARLYYLQLYGLVALFRLFLGKKRNPLRGRIDSCRYSTDQLFMGTLAFTILLFLLPTTLMYYVVFTSLRVAIVGLGGCLARVRFLIEVLPLYATVLWLLKSVKVGSNTFWRVRQKAQESDPLTLLVEVVAGSWWQTVGQCVPDSAQPPPAVKWLQLLQDLLVGRLIYPV